MEPKDILKKLDRIDDLPTLPTVAIKINRMLNDSNTSIREVSGTIEKDLSVVTKLLRLVNSAFFGVRSKVADVPHAVTLLGFNAVRNAVLSVSVFKAFSGKNTADGFNPASFWAHSLAVAVTSKHIGESTRLVVADECFLGGLVHDIGKVILAQHFQDLFELVWAVKNKGSLTFLEAENRELPIGHARLGAALAKKWQLPNSVTDTIRRHHKVNDHCADKNLVMIVHTADIIVNRFYRNELLDGSQSNMNICPDAQQALRSQIKAMREWFPDVKSEIDSACQFFMEEDKI